MPDTHEYPENINDILDDNMKFPRATIQAILAFRASKPWRGTQEERIQKLSALHQDLLAAYGKSTNLAFMRIDDTPSDLSNYCAAIDTITLIGRLSVITYLHEFAHALGRHERGACRWSVNLFRRFFPRSFARLRAEGHVLRRPEAPDAPRTE